MNDNAVTGTSRLRATSSRADGGAELRRNRLAYRTFLRAQKADSAVETVVRSFEDWLREKNVTVDEPSEQQRAEIARASEAGTTYVVCRLEESTGAMGSWQSELLASSEGWIHLAVTNSDGRRVNVPRIARKLMRELDLRDASMHLEDEVRLWDVDQVPQLVELVTDPDRHGLVFVAGTGPDFALYEGFRDRLPVWMREVYGLAQCILLTPQATVMLGERLGIHGVAPWTIRTYLPDVRLGSVVDSRRHRYLSIGTLAQEPDGRVRQRLADIARIHAAQRATPVEVFEARRILERAATEAVIDRLRPTTAAKPPLRTPDDATLERDELVEVDQPLKPTVERAELSLAELRSLLGVERLTPEALQDALGAKPTIAVAESSDLDEALELMEGQLRRIERLEGDLQEVRGLLDDDLIEQAELSADNEAVRDHNASLQAEVRWLRAKLVQEGSEEAYAAAPTFPAAEVPESCAALVASLSSDPVLTFTGDVSSVEEVDESDGLGVAVREATRSCVALREYARAVQNGDASNGVDHFLRHTPNGYQGISAGKHAQGETQVTMTQFGKERLFTVPTDVDPSGLRVMKAHFKLARIGRISPRMYYFDDLARTGRVYIGYLGRHLTNTQSN